MCGIVGLLRRDNAPADRAAIEQATKLLRHRGPDASATFVAGPLAIGHTRLSIVDTSPAANQPFIRGDHALVYNGEVYNHVELRRQLEADGVEFTTTCDTEVVFEACRHFGVLEATKRLRGMFAFAFAHVPSSTVHLVRDRLGIKPLVYATPPWGVVFASESKALAPLIELRPDPIRTLLSVNGGVETSRRLTAFHNVWNVEPGQVIELSAANARSKEHRYFNALDEIDEAEYRRLDGLDARSVTEEFGELITHATRRMLMSDVPVGTFLSGGIDSALICSLGTAEGPLAAFTSDVGGDLTELASAQRNAALAGAHLDVSRFDRDDLLSLLPEATWFYGAPIVTHTNSVPFMRVAQVAADAGIKPVLTGEGADELFIGYARDAMMPLANVASAPLHGIEAAYGRVDPRLASLVSGRGQQAELQRVFDVAGGYENASVRSDAAERLDFVPRTRRALQARTLELVCGHLVGLLHRNDRMGMAASIESRFPFLDEPLVRFAINLPTRHKLARQRRFHQPKHPFLLDKAPVRRFAAGRLGDGPAYQRKTGFPLYGYDHIRARAPGFFETGFLEDLLGLTQLENRMRDHAAPYFVAKLMAVEVFGRVFDRGESTDSVSELLHRHFEVIDHPL